MNAFTLESHLQTYTKLALSRFMGFLPNTDKRPARKDEIVAYICDELLDGNGLKYVWTDLSELERQALIDAVNDPATPGQLDRRAFQVRHAKLPSRSAERSHFNDYSAQRMALFFNEDYRVPNDLIGQLRKLIPPAPPYQLLTYAVLPNTLKSRNSAGREVPVDLIQVQTEPHAFHDLLATLRLIEGGKLKVSASTLSPGAPALRVLNEALGQPDYPNRLGIENANASAAIRPYGLITFAMMTGWASAVENGKLMLTQSGTDWMRNPSAQELREAFARGITSGVFDELYRVDGLHGTSNVLASFATPPAGRRTSVLRALRQCPVGHWVDVEDFFKWVRISGHDFVVEPGSESRFWTGAYGSYNNLPLGRTDTETYWRSVKCQFMLVFLFEYLAGLGLIDVAYVPLANASFYLGWQRWGGLLESRFSQYDGLKFVRLTTLGAYLLGLSKSYAATPIVTGPPLRVLPTHQIVLATRLPGTQSGHPMLTKFCTKVSDDVYQFAPERALKAIESGEMSAVEIGAYLERESDSALPQTLQLLLKEIGHKSASIEQAGDATLFRVGDAALALQLEHDRTLQRLGCRRSGDWLVVPRTKVSAFRRRVRELGFGVKSG